MGSKDVFPDIWMVQIEYLMSKKMSNLYGGWFSVILYSTLYTALNLTFHTDVGVIVSDGRITTDI